MRPRKLQLLFSCGTVFMYRKPDYQWHRAVQDAIDARRRYPLCAATDMLHAAGQQALARAIRLISTVLLLVPASTLHNPGVLPRSAPSLAKI